MKCTVRSFIQGLKLRTIRLLFMRGHNRGNDSAAGAMLSGSLPLRLSLILSQAVITKELSYTFFSLLP